jgi:hypothetical protein
MKPVPAKRQKSTPIHGFVAKQQVTCRSNNMAVASGLLKIGNLKLESGAS